MSHTGAIGVDIIRETHSYFGGLYDKQEQGMLVGVQLIMCGRDTKRLHPLVEPPNWW